MAILRRIYSNWRLGCTYVWDIATGIRPWQVVKGWYFDHLSKKGKLSKAVQELADARLSVCYDCEYKYGAICDRCGCVLTKKTKVPDEHCPENLWYPAIYADSKKQFIVLDELPPEVRFLFKQWLDKQHQNERPDVLEAPGEVAYLWQWESFCSGPIWGDRRGVLNWLLSR